MGQRSEVMVFALQHGRDIVVDQRLHEQGSLDIGQNAYDDPGKYKQKSELVIVKQKL